MRVRSLVTIVARQNPMTNRHESGVTGGANEKNGQELTPPAELADPPDLITPRPAESTPPLQLTTNASGRADRYGPHAHPSQVAHSNQLEARDGDVSSRPHHQTPQPEAGGRTPANRPPADVETRPGRVVFEDEVERMRARRRERQLLAKRVIASPESSGRYQAPAGAEVSRQLERTPARLDKAERRIDHLEEDLKRALDISHGRINGLQEMLPDPIRDQLSQIATQPSGGQPNEPPAST